MEVVAFTHVLELDKQMHSLILATKRDTKWGILLSFMYIITYFAALKSKYYLIGPKHQPNPAGLMSF